MYRRYITVYYEYVPHSTDAGTVYTFKKLLFLLIYKIFKILHIYSSNYIYLSNIKEEPRKSKLYSIHYISYITAIS